MKSPSVTRFVRMIGVVLALALLAAACGDDDPSSSAAEPAPTEAPATTEAPGSPADTDAPATIAAPVEGPATGEPIKIGLWADLTGNLAPFDTTYVTGARLAVEALNASGGVNGRPMELLVEDMGNDPQRAVQVFEKLSSEGVVAYLAGVSSQGAAALGPMFAESGKTAMVGATLGEDPVGMYSMTPSLVMDAEVRIAMLQSRGITRVGVLHDATPYNRFLRATIEPMLDDAGIEISGFEEHPLDVVDLRVQVQSVLDDDVGAILKLSAGPSDVVAAKAMAQAETDAILMLGPQSTVIVSQAVEAFTDVFWLAWPVQVLDVLEPGAVPDALTEFADAFEGNDADPGFAAQAWDAVFVMADVLSQAADFEAQTIQSELNALPIVPGASATYDFSAPGLSVLESPYYVATISAGQPAIALPDN